METSAARSLQLHRLIHAGLPARLARRVSLRHKFEMTLTRITIDPAACTGKPCIRGLRFPARLLGLLAAGETREQILKAYPYLEPGDIDEALAGDESSSKNGDSLSYLASHGWILPSRGSHDAADPFRPRVVERKR
jgi:uncharacterized protein (DUF433 family)